MRSKEMFIKGISNYGKKYEVINIIRHEYGFTENDLLDEDIVPTIKIKSKYFKGCIKKYRKILTNMEKEAVSNEIKRLGIEKESTIDEIVSYVEKNRVRLFSDLN